MAATKSETNMTPDRKIASYSSYTYGHPSFLVSYPHRRRQENQEELVLALAPTTWLDYGSGDGCLVLEMHRKGTLPQSVICYEPVETMHDQLTEKLSEAIEDKSLRCVSDLHALDGEKIPLVSSFGVLEHLTLPQRIEFYCFLVDKLSDNGLCLIEVPVEYGPVLLLSELGRKFLKNRQTEYKFGELMKASFLGSIEDSNRRYQLSDNRTFISAHRGFDLSRFLGELSAIGRYKQVKRSPFRFLPLWCNQTVFFLFELQVKDKQEIRHSIEALGNH